jgi:hypothetical protein
VCEWMILLLCREQEEVIYLLAYRSAGSHLNDATAVDARKEMVLAG